MEPRPTPTAARAGLGLVVALGVFLLALLFGAWGVWQVARGGRPPACNAKATALLEQRVATLGRSDQISRDANRQLQSTLADREEQIAQLRADVDFYERLVGATGQRHGLSVHALRMQRQAGNAWHFTAVLTQNLDRAAVSTGELTLSVEGSRGGRMQTLDWNALRQQPKAPGTPFSFRYFQEVEGDVLLPADFAPVRVSVHLKPRGRAAVDHAVTWAEATSPAPATAP
ncbi:hypothetical protein GCM10008101_18480 [Lysobacter xinjiangensis]|uniref:Transmembrane protein n=1 Tax=Cognatilysobacter xinjiangensis TaxID=546892 RepID=A0ABQ3C279_9GAMM|nr:DUF6776 family protein [Lysobacter xinjiangensis]GGZ65033.1 hypothetical protein GCM10008101_18480 [Lysobacter xinjiangensis]